MIAGLSTMDLLISGAVFMLTMCVTAIGGLMWVYNRNKRTEFVRRRIGAVEGMEDAPKGGRVVRLFHDGHEFEAILPGLGDRATSPLKAIKARCKAAGITTPLPTLLMMATAIAIGTFVVIWVLTRHTPGAVLGSCGVIYLLWIGIKMKGDKIAAKFDDQFVEALDLCARSLRGWAHGHRGPVARGPGIQGTGQERHERHRAATGDGREHSRKQLRARRRQARKPGPQTLRRLRRGADPRGGNLAETTNRLSAVIRDRLRLGRRVRVLIAQTQMSKQVLLGLPVVVFILLNVINPEYVRPMYETEGGQTLLAISLGSMILGTWAMNKMAVIKY